MRQETRCLVIASLLAGCAATEPEPELEPIRPLVVLAADADRGLVGTLDIDGEVIGFEAIREPVAEPAPGGPVFEVSARFLDADGATIAMLSQGHGPAGWLEGMDRAAGRGALARVARAGDTLAEIADAAVAPERDLLITLARNTQRSLAESLAPGDAVGFIEEPVCGDGSCGPWESCWDCPWDCGYCEQPPPPPEYPKYIQRTIIYKAAFWNSSIADHSATTVRRFAFDCAGCPWYPVAEWSFCNHGRCPWDMQAWCWSDGLATRYPVAPYECTTGYDASSLFGHNCNDDTRLQNLIAHYNVAYSSTSGVCNSFSTHSYADYCESGCGNGFCSGSEACYNCPADCGGCAGNGSCEYFEDCGSAPYDCGPCTGCPDGYCDYWSGENPNTCPDDCDEW
jgi:hypothetical protein